MHKSVFRFFVWTLTNAGDESTTRDGFTARWAVVRASTPSPSLGLGSAPSPSM